MDPDVFWNCSSMFPTTEIPQLHAVATDAGDHNWQECSVSTEWMCFCGTDKRRNIRIKFIGKPYVTASERSTGGPI